MTKTWALIMVLVLMADRGTNSKDVAEFCQNESFKTRCGSDQVIVMTSARYGRMRFSRCIDRDYGYVGQCSVDVISDADTMCSGRRHCEIEVPNSVLDSKKACPKDLKSYLETRHTCIHVLSGEGRRCEGGQPHILTEPTAILASVLTEETNLGSADCPWVIRAKPGQHVNVTLYDFATTELRGEVCHAYAILRETEPTRSITVCSSTTRERNVYTSVSNTVEVRVLRSKQILNNKDKYFILKYEFIGCADPSKPINGWMRREGDIVTMGCIETTDTWRLTCKGGQWEGTFSNCTLGANVAGVLGEVPWGGISIVIIIGIALAIGVVILAVGLLILKWQRRRSAAKAARLQNDNQYEAGRKHSPSRRSAGSPKETDPYYSTENEYAYIADVPTPTPPPVPPMLPPGRENYAPTAVAAAAAGKRFTFNTVPSAVPGGPIVGGGGSGGGGGGTGSYNPQEVAVPHIRPTGYMKNTNAHGLRDDDRPRYEGSVNMAAPPYPVVAEGEDPPKYFELDPKAVKPESARALPPPPPTRDSTSYQNEVPMMATRGGSVGPRSIHDFSPVSYDQLEESMNHKSV